MPDYVSVTGRDGSIVGYARRSDVLDPPSVADTPEQALQMQGEMAPVEVFAEDLRTIVGHVYANRGFVPLNTDPETVPTTPVVTAAK